MGIYSLISCSSSEFIGFNDTALDEHCYKREKRYNPQGQTDLETNFRGNQITYFLNNLQDIWVELDVSWLKTKQGVIY